MTGSGRPTSPGRRIAASPTTRGGGIYRSPALVGSSGRTGTSRYNNYTTRSGAVNTYGTRRGGSRGYIGYGTRGQRHRTSGSRSGANSGWIRRSGGGTGGGRGNGHGHGHGHSYQGHGYYGYGWGAGIYFSFGYGYVGFGYSWGYPYYGHHHSGYYTPYSYYPSYCYGSPYYWYPYYWHGNYRYPYYYPYYPRFVVGAGPFYYSSYYYPYYYPYDDNYRAPKNPARETDPSDPAVRRINELIEGERFEEAGLALFQQDEYDLAAEFFKKAIYKQGDDASSTLRLRLGVAYFAAADQEMADFAIRNGLRDGVPATSFDVKGLYSHPATFDQQYSTLGDVAYAEGASSSARFTFAFLATQVGDTEAARPVLDGLLLEDPNDGASRALRESISP